MKMAYSFNKVSINDALKSISPPKIKILRNFQENNLSDSVKEKSNLQTKFSTEIFEVINDLTNKSQEKQKIKFIY